MAIAGRLIRITPAQCTAWHSRPIHISVHGTADLINMNEFIVASVCHRSTVWSDETADSRTCSWVSIEAGNIHNVFDLCRFPRDQRAPHKAPKHAQQRALAAIYVHDCNKVFWIWTNARVNARRHIAQVICKCKKC